MTAAAPLSGFRVLDLGNFITAPYATMLLGEMGAEVIKVERPGDGDPFRAFKGGQYSPHFQAHNRCKKSLSLDYGIERGREVLWRLIESSDALVINARPGVPAKLGIGPDKARVRNPRLIYCSITGFGETGPSAGRAAFDGVGQAASGWMGLFHRGEDPRVFGPAVADAATGVFAALSIAGALAGRSRDGEGRTIEVNMLQAMMAFATEPLAHVFATGTDPSFYGRAANSQTYAVTCADGKRIVLHMSSPDKFWQGLTKAIDRPDILEKFPTRAARVENYEAIARALAQAFKLRSRAEWVPRLEQHDVPFAAERRLSELESDAQVRHLGAIVSMTHPVFGTLRAPAFPARFSGAMRDPEPPPGLGEHTDAILDGLGLGPTEVADLRQQGIV